MGFPIECVDICQGEVVIYTLDSDEYIIGNFQVKELACPLAMRLKIPHTFLKRLEQLRGKWDKPLKVNSCCRSFDHNEIVGGHVRSLHLMDNPHWPVEGTVAIDICTVGWGEYEVDSFLELAWSLGFSYGRGENFVHLDLRELAGLPQTKFTY